MSFIAINVPAIQGALFNDQGGKTVKVYGKECPVLMSGNIGAADVKNPDGSYSPTAYGRLTVKAAKATTKAGKEYLALLIDGGLQGRLNRAEGQSYDYVGSIDAGNNKEFVIFGRKRSSEGGMFIALSSAELKDKQSDNSAPKQNGSNSKSNDDDFSDNVPF